MTTLSDTKNSHLSDVARDNMWLHFTRHSGYEQGGPVPIINRGEGAYVFEENGRRIQIGRAHV